MSASEKLLDEVPPNTTAGLTRRQRLQALHAAVAAHIEQARDVFEEEDDEAETDCDNVGCLLELAGDLNLLMREAQREYEAARMGQPYPGPAYEVVGIVAGLGVKR